MSNITDKLAELFQGDIQAAIEETLCVEAGSARVITENIFVRLQKKWGSRSIYIPVHDIASRNQSIRAQFTGRNHAEICKRYEISLSHLYRIIKN